MVVPVSGKGKSEWPGLRYFILYSAEEPKSLILNPKSSLQGWGKLVTGVNRGGKSCILVGILLQFGGNLVYS